jgi:pimeloyl-ACP methyl ester carboxylesterase
MRPLAMIRLSAAVVFACLFFATPARAESNCDPDGVQSSGSIYRICMPAPEQYNGILVVWAHGFQDAGTPVSIPEDQLCLGDFCIPEVINGLGFGFATNSYRKTGMAIAQGKDDIIDLVSIYAAQKGQPQKVFLVGASEGGIITALALEQRPDIFAAGLAACGPVGNFPAQINYFGDARATFNYFFPGLIPGDPFNPDPALIAVWSDYYDFVVKPIVMAPANRARLDEWVRVARLPYDAGNYLFTVEQSVKDALRYSVVNLQDAIVTIGGFPFDNSRRYYTGSSNDILLNLAVPRRTASPAALAVMNSPAYSTSGVLQRPLITLHTLRDQQVPYWHEQLYALKTLASGSYLTRHLNIPIDRFEHCNFTTDEVLASFAIMLFYDGVLGDVTGTSAFLNPAQLAAFEARTHAIGLPTNRAGSALKVSLKPPR